MPAPATIAGVKAACGRILLGCACGWQHYVDLDAELRSGVGADTVEYLQRSGRWRCGACGRHPAAMVYDPRFSTGFRQVERWADD